MPGTIFPLLLNSFGGSKGATPLALDAEVETWQRLLNDERLVQVAEDSEAYAAGRKHCKTRRKRRWRCRGAPPRGPE